jgi:hypothetical protein
MAEAIRAVLERDSRGEFADWSEFDDALWRAVCDVVNDPCDIARFPESFQFYYATRLLEWDVGNGGFAQAAMNYPEFFELAARGYEALGKGYLASFVREASILAERERTNIDGAREGGLENAFEYFREGVFDKFDERLEEVGWFTNDEDRLNYVRANREVFATLRQPGNA